MPLRLGPEIFLLFPEPDVLFSAADPPGRKQPSAKHQLAVGGWERAKSGRSTASLVVLITPPFEGIPGIDPPNLLNATSCIPVTPPFEGIPGSDPRAFEPNTGVPGRKPRWIAIP